jgi:hypothetical protein
MTWADRGMPPAQRRRTTFATQPSSPSGTENTVIAEYVIAPDAPTASSSSSHVPPIQPNTGTSTPATSSTTAGGLGERSTSPPPRTALAGQPRPGRAPHSKPVTTGNFWTITSCPVDGPLAPRADSAPVGQLVSAVTDAGADLLVLPSQPGARSPRTATWPAGSWIRRSVRCPGSCSTAAGSSLPEDLAAASGDQDGSSWTSASGASGRPRSTGPLMLSTAVSS